MACPWTALNEAFNTGHVCANSHDAIRETMTGRAGIFHMKAKDKDVGFLADVLVGILNQGETAARFTLRIPPSDPISGSVEPGKMRPLRLPLLCIYHTAFWGLDSDSLDDLVYVFGQVPQDDRRAIANGAWNTGDVYAANGSASSVPRTDAECQELPLWNE